MKTESVAMMMCKPEFTYCTQADLAEVREMLEENLSVEKPEQRPRKGASKEWSRVPVLSFISFTRRC